MIIALPLLGAVFVMCMPRAEATFHRGLGLTFTTTTFLVSLAVLKFFNPKTGDFQLVFDVDWIPGLGAHFKTGVDGISVFLVILTTFLMPLTLLGTAKAITKHVREFIAAMLVLEAGMLGAFVALDVFLFYVFWEVMLIPMYLLIGIWGGQRRLYASIKFVIYTMTGSLVMLVAIFYVYVQHAHVTGEYTTDLVALKQVALPHNAQIWCFAAFTLAFAIKVPLFPLHTWLPDAHVEAPTAGSVILAGVMLKFGVYGMLRYSIPLFPHGAQVWAPAMCVLAIIGIIYGALVAFTQDDVKKLVAYSSVSHMGFCVLGVFAMTVWGISGSIYAMLSHGLTTGGLFLGIGVLYERRHTRRLAEYGGVWKQMPVFAGLFLIVTMGSAGLPSLSGFVGEFLTIFGTFNAGDLLPTPDWIPAPRLLGALAATGVILGAIYLLFMFQKVFFGKLDKAKNGSLPDLGARELSVFVPLCLAIFALGMFPKPILESMEKSVESMRNELVGHVAEPDGEARYYPEFKPATAPPTPATTPPATPPTGGAPDQARRWPMTSFDPTDLGWLVPYLILIVAGMLLVLAEAFFTGSGTTASGRADHTALSGLAVAGSLASALASIVLYRQLDEHTSHAMFGGMLIADRPGYVLSTMFAITTALTALIAPAHQREHGWTMGELYGVLLLAASGCVMLAHANNLVTVFLGIETMSIGTYVMVALRRHSRRGNEAAMKYFLMGAFSTGFLLYGMALLYGATGTLQLDKIAAAIPATANPGLIITGGFLLVVAFGFKVSAVPFHMWAPDAYEGAPTPITGFMAAAIKAAAIAGAIRVFVSALGGGVVPFGSLGWASPMVVIAGITITVGNITAVRQDNIKRMLAYSSIAHAGVLLVGLSAAGLGSPTGVASLVYYIIAYSVATLGAFAVVAYVGSKGRERLHVDDWAGLAAQHPAAALAMTVCLLSFGGMPPTGGFFAKFYIFKSAMDVHDGQLLWLVIIGVVNSAISIYYYLRIVTAMYFREANQPFSPTKSGGLLFVIAVMPLLVLELGIMPGWWLKLIGQ